MKLRIFSVVILMAGTALLSSCSTNPHRSPGGTVFGSTVGGAGLGALVGWAAGDAGVGAAIGAGVGLIAGAIQADEDAQARDHHFHDAPPAVVVRDTRRDYRDNYAVRETRAQELLSRAQRTGNISESIRLLKRSLTEYRTPEAHTALGEIYEHRGNLSRAENEYRRALDLDQDYRPARDHLIAMNR